MATHLQCCRKLAKLEVHQMSEDTPHNPIPQPPAAPPPIIESSMPPQTQAYPREGFQPTAPNDDPLRFVIPVNPSLWAVIAGYMGLLSITLVFAPFALLTGIFGLRDLKRNPNKTGKFRAWFGTIMGVVFTGLLLFVVGANLLNKK